jgi:hypothetical protein
MKLVLKARQRTAALSKAGIEMWCAKLLRVKFNK